MPFKNPLAFWLIVPIIVILAFIIRRDFVSRLKRKDLRKELIRNRLLILISRSLIFTLLVIAIASPFSLETVLSKGSPTLTILIDNSSSMQLLDTSGIQDLQKSLESRIPVRSRSFGLSTLSPLGDALLNEMEGDDNILIVSDGNSNYGRSLGDMLVLASALNSTVNGLNLRPAKQDSAVLIFGPRLTTTSQEIDLDVAVNQFGGQKSYNLIITIDNEEVVNKAYSGSNTLTLTNNFAEGYHTIKAEIIVDDFYPENNIFYKTIKVEPRPRILFVTKDPSPINQIYTSLYETTTTTDLSDVSLSDYSALVLNNIPISQIDTNRLSNYVIDGNGLVVIGGKNSYDRGGYKDSLFEGMLPVRVGKGSEEKRTDVSVALVIDISGSTGTGFGEFSTSSIEDVEKALAVSIINDLRNDDKIAVIAFNTDAFIVSDLSKVLGNKGLLQNRIETLVYKGGTRIDEGIQAARKILAPLEGSKNMIILSDGKSGSYTEDLYDAQIAANTGIKIYTVGVGEGTNRKHLQQIASVGNGYYFEPDETDRFKVVFGESESIDTTTFPLELVNSQHFVTYNVKISGKVNGFNQVVPKLNADMLVATQSNNPILTVSRLGLGRIVALSTDDGSAWASELLSSPNSKLITRATNWAVGDLSRNKKFDVDIKDVHLGETMEVNVVSSSNPNHDALNFAKIGKRLYTAPYNPQTNGFHKFFDAVVAVNYEKEYAALGVNKEFESIISFTGGKIFNQEDVDAIVEKVKEDSKRIIAKPITHSWWFLLAALLVFLAEVAYRRIQEGKR